jgi:hypothetical protein
MSFIRLAMFSSLLNLVVDFWVQSFRLQSNGQSNLINKLLITERT